MGAKLDFNELTGVASFAGWHRCYWRRRGLKPQGDGVLESLVASLPHVVSSWAFLHPPLLRCSPCTSCFVQSSLNLHAQSFFYVPHCSSPHFHIRFGRPGRSNAAWLRPLVLATEPQLKAGSHINPTVGLWLREGCWNWQ